MSDLTTRDAAAELQASTETVRNLIADGSLPGAYRLRGDHGPWRIPPASIEAHRENQKNRDPWARTRPVRRSTR